MEEKCENSCCLLVNEARNNFAQGILCCLTNLRQAQPRAQFGLLTCHHVIPSMDEILGWTIYYGGENPFQLEPLIISNFYSCCNKESGNEHFGKACHVNLDYTLIVFNEDAPIDHDIELLDVADDRNSLDKLKNRLPLKCRIFQRLPYTGPGQPVRTIVRHEDHYACFYNEENGDMSTFIIKNPNKIKGHGSSGCLIVFYADGFPCLLGMHTASYKNNKYSSILFLENTSTIWINELIKKQIGYAALNYDVLLCTFLQYTMSNRDNSIETKHCLWTMANHLCINESVKSRKEIKDFCKCIIINYLLHSIFNSH